MVHGVSPQSVNITGLYNTHRVSLWFSQPFFIDSAGFPCGDPEISSPCSFHGVKICSVELVDERKNQKVQLKPSNECVGTTYKPHRWLIFAWFHKCIAHQAHNFLSVISKKNFNVKAKISSKQVWKRYLIRYSAYNPFWTGIKVAFMYQRKGY